MAKSYDPSLIAKMCEAFGVERINEVTRVVLDIRAGDMPRLLVERIADAATIFAALRGPLIDVRRDDPGASEAKAPQVRTCNCAVGDSCDVPWHWQDVSTMDGKG